MKASAIAKRSKKYLRRFMQVDTERYLNLGHNGANMNQAQPPEGALRFENGIEILYFEGGNDFIIFESPPENIIPLGALQYEGTSEYIFQEGTTNYLTFQTA
jgi:hypothetical protein